MSQIQNPFFVYIMRNKNIKPVNVSQSAILKEELIAKKQEKTNTSQKETLL